MSRSLITETYSLPKRRRSLGARYRVDRWFVASCLAVAFVSVVILAVLLTAILAQGLPAQLAPEKHPEIKDGSESTMENLHTSGFFSQAICGMSGEQLSAAVVSAYRGFYWRPALLYEHIKQIRTFEELMIKVIAGLNIFRFSVGGQK